MEKHLLLNKLYRKKENKFIKKVVILAITTQSVDKPIDFFYGFSID